MKYVKKKKTQRESLREKTKNKGIAKENKKR